MRRPSPSTSCDAWSKSCKFCVVDCSSALWCDFNPVDDILCCRDFPICCRFGGKLDDYPHPELEFDQFLHCVEQKSAAAGQTWDPIDKKNKPWIDARKLKTAYGKHGCILS